MWKKLIINEERRFWLDVSNAERIISEFIKNGIYFEYLMPGKNSNLYFSSSFYNSETCSSIIVGAAVPTLHAIRYSNNSRNFYVQLS